VRPFETGEKGSLACSPPSPVGPLPIAVYGCHGRHRRQPGEHQALEVHRQRAFGDRDRHRPEPPVEEIHRGHPPSHNGARVANGPSACNRQAKPQGIANPDCNVLDSQAHTTHNCTLNQLNCSPFGGIKRRPPPQKKNLTQKLSTQTLQSYEHMDVSIQGRASAQKCAAELFLPPSETIGFEGGGGGQAKIPLPRAEQNTRRR
jgi:hypothetical protein